MFQAIFVTVIILYVAVKEGIGIIETFSSLCEGESWLLVLMSVTVKLNEITVNMMSTEIQNKVIKWIKVKWKVHKEKKMF